MQKLKNQQGKILLLWENFVNTWFCNATGFAWNTICLERDFSIRPIDADAKTETIFGEDRLVKSLFWSI